jgi:hypothetical protein
MGAESHHPPSTITLIGDVVGSKRATDRALLQQQLGAALEGLNQVVPAAQPLTLTIGDEFQATYRSLGVALRVTLLLRLTLLPDIDVRYGVGHGGVTVFDIDRRPVSQDGPGWWAARDAINHVKAQEAQRGRARFLRTWFVDGSPVEPAPTADRIDLSTSASINAFLLSRDETVGRQTDRNRRLMLGWLAGLTQSELAAKEQITQSAVSQQLSTSGAYAIRDAHDLLEGRTPWSS